MGLPIHIASLLTPNEHANVWQRSGANVWWVDSTNGSNTRSGKGPRGAFATIQKAVDSVADGKGDVIYVMPGAYDETVTIGVTKNNLTIIGLGGRGAAYIEPTTAGAEGMQVLANDVTLVNLGIAAEGTASYALNVQGSRPGGTGTKYGKRFRAYGCKIEAGSGASLPAILFDGTADYQATDALLEDCEICWAAVGIQFDNSSYGVPTQIFVENCKFHNITVACINEKDAGAYVVNLIVTDCVFESAEDGSEPTDWIVVDNASSSGLFSGNRFATATNATGVLTIGAKIMWVGNITEAGMSTARPS